MDIGKNIEQNKEKLPSLQELLLHTGTKNVLPFKFHLKGLWDLCKKYGYKCFIKEYNLTDCLQRHELYVDTGKCKARLRITEELEFLE